MAGFILGHEFKAQSCGCLSGKDARPRGGADRRWYIAVGKSQSVGGQTIDVWSSMIRVPVAVKIGPAKIVDENENDVGAPALTSFAEALAKRKATVRISIRSLESRIVLLPFQRSSTTAHPALTTSRVFVHPGAPQQIGFLQCDKRTSMPPSLCGPLACPDDVHAAD